MENNNMNLLDLGDDILNIIGDYVKKDNYIKKIEDISKNSIKLLKIVKKGCWKTKKPDMRHLIINYLYVNNIRDIETIDIVLTLMKLNLKQKKYPFSTFCIENYEDSKTTYDKILEQNSLLYYIDGKPYISNIKRFFH
jgi:hypothetical protein